jgi:hypothetical protein
MERMGRGIYRRRRGIELGRKSSGLNAGGNSLSRESRRDFRPEEEDDFGADSRGPHVSGREREERVPVRAGLLGHGPLLLLS